ncbi:MAG: FtsW/RodA/SpoVE family cell cycle protein [Kiritimatiellae bacterium]|jgi:cell division protein FtsW (lipid II flippase)|nr:FtsW/RodA/SpoVE family cell cycle protein [Kiritimatiellia bacterium]
MKKKKGTSLFRLLALDWLVVALACSMAVFSKFQLGASLPLEPLLPLAIFTIAIPVTVIWLKMLRWEGDVGFIGAVFLLCGLGLVTQIRLSGFESVPVSLKALLPLTVGFFAFLAGVSITGGRRGKWMNSAGWLAYFGALGVIAVMLVFGRHYRGGIYLPGRINPSELIKPLLVLFMAAFLANRAKAFSETQVGIPTPPLSALVHLVFLWAIPMVGTLLLKDLGLMVILNAILIVMLFAVSRRSGYLGLGCIAVTAAGYGVQLISSNARDRFAVWLHPFADATGKGWQVLQSLSAMYSGGMWGAGIGGGDPRFVPIASSDFVYAALAEEIGFIGCLLVLCLYAVLFVRGFRAAGMIKAPFERLLCIGLTGTLAVQTVFNIAGVTKALPMTGITLPLISHGGSSLIVTLLVCGLIAGLSDSRR